MLEIRLLGQFEVKLDGRPIRFTSYPAQLLLTCLALEAGTPLRREKIAARLWPDTNDASARTNLRQTLWRLGQVLKSNRVYLITDNDQIELNLNAGVLLDVREFTRRRTTRSLSTDELMNALEAYTGELLPGFYEEWIEDERQHLQVEFERKLEMLIERLQQEERWVDLRNWSNEFLARVDRTSEKAYCALMTAYAKLDNMTRVEATYKLCIAVLERELGTSPSLETRQLYDELRQQHRQRRGPPGPESINNHPVEAPPQHSASGTQTEFPPLPTPRTTNLTEDNTLFVGRERELAELTLRLAESTCSLITLMGPGGIGKTRLARHVAQLQLGQFADGVFFIALTAVTSLDSLISAIADVVQFSFYGKERPRQQLLDYVREKQMLLVLDNFEQLLESADLLTELLATAPNLKLLVTSRERLHLPSEWILEIDGLEFPSSFDAPDPEAYTAVQLFMQTARRLYSRTSFVGELEEVTRICRLVEGMPLAIEMAAAWVRVLPCVEIARQIEQTLMLLTKPLPHVPARQYSMRAVFEQSWHLLSDVERKVLQRLAIFQSGFQREAAEKVTGASLSQLASLADKSLVRRQPSGRFEMHELIRHFATEKLRETEDEHSSEVETRLGHYFLEYANLHQHLYTELELEWGNLVAGMRAAHRHQQWGVVLGYVDALSDAWFARNRLTEARQGYAWAQDAVQGLNYPRGLGTVLCDWGRACFGQSDYEEAEKLFRQSVQLSRDYDDKAGAARALYYEGEMYIAQANFNEGASRIRESLTLYEEINQVAGIANALLKKAEIEYYAERHPEALELARQALDMQHAVGDSVSSIKTLRLLANSYREQRFNEPDQTPQLLQLAYECGHQALELCSQLHQQDEMAFVLRSLAGISQLQGNLTVAREYAERSIVLLKRKGDRRNQAICQLELSMIYEKLDELTLCLNAAESSLTRCRELGDTFGSVYPLTVIGDTHKRLGQTALACQKWQEALALAESIVAVHPQADLLRQRLLQTNCETL